MADGCGWSSGGYLIANDVATTALLVTLAPGVTAFGADLSSFGSGDITIALAGGGTLTLASPGQPNFAFVGFTSDQDILSLAFSKSGDNVVLDNVAFGQTSGDRADRSSRASLTHPARPRPRGHGCAALAAAESVSTSSLVEAAAMRPLRCRGPLSRSGHLETAPATPGRRAERQPHPRRGFSRRRSGNPRGSRQYRSAAVDRCSRT